MGEKKNKKSRELRKRKSHRENPLWHSALLEVCELCDATGTILPDVKKMSLIALQEYRDILGEKFKRQEQKDEEI